jgi:putative FmdB family regulatory protein
MNEGRMPTYEYRCVRCEHEFEEFQRISDPPLRRCPKCRGRVERLIGTGAGFLFKGSGFYTTDYRSEKYHSAAKAEKGSAAAPAAAPAKSAAAPPPPAGKTP